MVFLRALALRAALNCRTSSTLERWWPPCFRAIGILLLVAVFDGGSASAQPVPCVTTVNYSPVVSETWTAAGSPYCVTQNIDVSLLTIEEGVEVQVDGPYRIEVISTITAIGTAANPITFTARDPGVPWKGIRFDTAQAGSKLVHCIIEESDERGLTLIDTVPAIENCVIRNNTVDGNGAGIHARLRRGLVLLITGTSIEGNTASGAIYASGGISRYGGGLYIIGDALLQDSRVADNLARSRDTWPQAHAYARGGGIYFDGRLSLVRSTVTSNVARAEAQGPPPLRGFAYAYGGGVFSAGGEVEAYNSTISCNSVEALCIGDGNCLVGDRGNAWANGSAAFINAHTAQIVNSAISNNDGFASRNGQLKPPPTALVADEGLRHVHNAIAFFDNGDEVDGAYTVTYSDIDQEVDGEGNISVNPTFADHEGCESDELRIVSGSLAIDAGDRQQDPDPEFDDVCFPPSLGTVRNDMGAHGGPLACLCGDGTLSDPVEECDDGNLLGGDGCSALCTIEGSCGNGVIDPGEECDDWNTISGDGCDADCLLGSYCGDDLVDTEFGEDCDDGNSDPGDGCDENCHSEVCGNGWVQVDEECDDGNLDPGDGCDENCQIEVIGTPTATPTPGTPTATPTPGTPTATPTPSPSPPPTRLCSAVPNANCIVAAKASLSVNEKKTGKEKLKAKLQGFGDPTAQSDFGNPVSGATRYDLCIYGPGDARVEELNVDRAAQTCGPKAKDCWKDKGGKGWKYKDPSASADGVQNITAMSGSVGKGKVKLKAGNKAKKGQVDMPTGIAQALQGVANARVQLVTSDAQCFEAVLGTVKKADGVKFMAKKP